LIDFPSARIRDSGHPAVVADDHLPRGLGFRFVLVEIDQTDNRNRRSTCLSVSTAWRWLGNGSAARRWLAPRNLAPAAADHPLLEGPEEGQVLPVGGQLGVLGLAEQIGMAGNEADGGRSQVKGGLDFGLSPPVLYMRQPQRRLRVELMETRLEPLQSSSNPKLGPILLLDAAIYENSSIKREREREKIVHDKGKRPLSAVSFSKS
jgi:hypothetical protein